MTIQEHAPAVREEKHKPFITITRGGSGWFAVHMWWNDTGEHDLPGFWEPWASGIGRYATAAEAEKEGREWAEAEELEFKVTP